MIFWRKKSFTWFYLEIHDNQGKWVLCIEPKIHNIDILDVIVTVIEDYCKLLIANLLALDLGIIVGKTISFPTDFSLIPCVGRKHLRSCNGILCFLPISSVHLILFIISSNVKVLWTTLPSTSICSNGTSIPWSALILEIYVNKSIHATGTAMLAAKVFKGFADCQQENQTGKTGKEGEKIWVKLRSKFQF